MALSAQLDQLKGRNNAHVQPESSSILLSSELFESS